MNCRDLTAHYCACARVCLCAVRRTDGGGCNLQQSALFRLPVAVYALLALRLMCAWCVKCSCCRNWNKTLSHSWLAMKNYWRRKCTCAACGGKRQQPDDDIEDWLDAKLLHVEHAKKKMVRLLLKMATAEHTSAERSRAQNSAEQCRIVPLLSSGAAPCLPACLTFQEDGIACLLDVLT